QPSSFLVNKHRKRKEGSKKGGTRGPHPHPKKQKMKPIMNTLFGDIRLHWKPLSLIVLTIVANIAEVFGIFLISFVAAALHWSVFISYRFLDFSLPGLGLPCMLCIAVDV
ncbi:hypothetical protein ACTOVN_08125, partial [Arcanobacterium canis]